MMFKKRGFTLVEILITIAIFVILAAISASVFILFEKQANLNNATELVINRLRNAQSKTLGSEEDSQYGLYFDNSSTPHQYTLFKGVDYTSRDFSYDKVYQLSEKIEIYNIDLNGGNSEVIFDKITGTTSQHGSISLRLKDHPSENKTIYIENSGQIGLIAIAPASDLEREKDSRHIHFDYNSRIIDINTEILTLNFESGLVIKTILIIDNIKDGQIYWEGEVDVSGDSQKLKIHTHRLDDFDTQFCIHRDRRYNNKSLTITLSGDGSGSLIEYSSDGLTTNFTSIHVTNLNWQ